MKRGWQKQRLAAVATKITDGSHNPPKGVPESDFLMLSSKNVFDDDLHYTDPRCLTAEQFHQEDKRTGIASGDVLLTIVGTVGRSAVVPDDAPRITLQRSVAVIRPKRELVESRFLMYSFMERSAELNEQARGVAQKGIYLETLRELEIASPPLPEQRRIVAILDEAFEGIATAQAKAEKNLANARAIFESHLQSVFAHSANEATAVGLMAERAHRGLHWDGENDAKIAQLNAGHVTRTGGRHATLRHIPARLSLAVGMPKTGAKPGWSWSSLSDLARLESGHTPSRRHPEYWGGAISWIGIQDARENHGKRIADTFQKTNELGIENSSARVLPEDTVCLSRTASVGYVVVMGRPMATSQDFVNWICSPRIDPDFLKFLFFSEGREGLLRFASGAVHQTIYFPEAKAFHIAHPTIEEQRRIAKQCDALAAETQRLARLYEQKLAALAALKKSLLHQAFTGEL